MADVTWLVTIFCPLLGVLISNAMFLSPLTAIVEARKKNKMGDLSPVPFAMMAVGQIGWTVYSFVTRDFYIFFSSCFGLLLGFFLCFTSFHLLERPKHRHTESITRLLTEGILLFGMTFWVFIFFIAFIILGTDDASRATAKELIGACSATCSLLFYASPLLNIYNIIKTKNSAALYAPSIVVNMCNNVLWFAYGLFALNVVSIWLPSAVGFFISFVQLMFRCAYPALARKNTIDGAAGVDNSMLPQDEESGTVNVRPRKLTHAERVIEAIIGLPESKHLLSPHNSEVEMQTSNSSLDNPVVAIAALGEASSKNNEENQNIGIDTRQTSPVMNDEDLSPSAPLTSAV